MKLFGRPADLPPMERDLLADVRVLQDAERLVVQDGRIHQNTLSPATNGAAT